MRPILLFFCFFIITCTCSAQLIINEFSQGGSGNKEYIELVVVGHRSCAGDSCMDIRGWIIDDNNGWFGAGAGQGIAIGHMRFSNDPNWSCVPYGSTILVYNNGDVNPSITLADDPTDANNDHIYVVPSTSAYLEHANTTPASPSSLTYVYPATTAYLSGGDWSTVGLANTGDAVTIVSPANLGISVHSIAYGNVTNGAAAVIYKATAGAARNYYLNNDQYTVGAAYIVGNVPADETPGMPNSIANAAWIASMLTNPTGNVISNIQACITQGNTYNFNSSLLTATGTYADTFSASSGCDSIVQLHLAVISPSVWNSAISGCNAVVYNGVTYTASVVLLDTLSTSLGCDSVYRNVFIQVHPANPVTARDTLSSCQSLTYKGVTYTLSQEVTDTLKTLTGCDSVYKKVFLKILETPLVTINPASAKICSGQSVTLTASSAAAHVAWNGFPPGNSITVRPSQSTVYIAYAVNDLNCIGTASVFVEVEHLGLQLSYSPAPAERGTPLTLTTSAGGSYQVLRWFPEALFSNQVAFSQTIIAGTQELVSVIGKSDNGCIDTASVRIDIVPKPAILMPNAFSPNGDGLNDYFCPQFTRDYKIHEFSIFNRYGQRVYHIAYTQQIGRGWDGTQGSQPCEAGTYFYHFSAEGPGGTIEKIKGDLTLVR